MRPSQGPRRCAPGLPSQTRAGQPRQRASRRHQPALPQRCVSPTPHPTSSIPIALKVPATPEHSAVSSIGICTTPARMRLWPALMSVVESRHPTNLNTIRQSCSLSEGPIHGSKRLIRFSCPRTFVAAQPRSIQNPGTRGRECLESNAPMLDEIAGSSRYAMR